jgi:hypothetical protein
MANLLQEDKLAQLYERNTTKSKIELTPDGGSSHEHLSLDHHNKY